MKPTMQHRPSHHEAATDVSRDRQARPNHHVLRKMPGLLPFRSCLNPANSTQSSVAFLYAIIRFYAGASDAEPDRVRRPQNQEP